MATIKKICRVCGKQYEACHATTRNLGAFRFKDVVCSPECFTIWVERVEASRKPASEIIEEVLVETPVVEEEVVEEAEANDEDMEIDC